MTTALSALACILAAAAPAEAGQRLVMFGGGAFPPAAVDRFLEGAGGKDARILFVTWPRARSP